MFGCLMLCRWIGGFRHSEGSWRLSCQQLSSLLLNYATTYIFPTSLPVDVVSSVMVLPFDFIQCRIISSTNFNL